MATASVSNDDECTNEDGDYGGIYCAGGGGAGGVDKTGFRGCLFIYHRIARILRPQHPSLVRPKVWPFLQSKRSTGRWLAASSPLATPSLLLLPHFVVDGNCAKFLHHAKRNRSSPTTLFYILWNIYLKFSGWWWWWQRRRDATGEATPLPTDMGGQASQLCVGGTF